MTKDWLNEEMLRLAIIALLVAIIFGILQYFPEDKKFEVIEMGVTLKVIAIVMLKTVMPLTFGVYLMFLGLNSRYNTINKFKKLQEFFYNLGIDLTIFVILFSSLITLLIWFLLKFPQFPTFIINSIIILFWIISGFILFNTIIKSRKEH